MENWEMFGRDSILNGTLMQPLSPETKLQQVSVNDVGAFAAIAFAKPSEWIGRAIDIAGDEASITETAAKYLDRINYTLNIFKSFRGKAFS
jgi:hypothetical protein